MSPLSFLANNFWALLNSFLRCSKILNHRRFKLNCYFLSPYFSNETCPTLTQTRVNATVTGYLTQFVKSTTEEEPRWFLRSYNSNPLFPLSSSHSILLRFSSKIIEESVFFFSFWNTVCFRAACIRADSRSPLVALTISQQPNSHLLRNWCD